MNKPILAAGAIALAALTGCSGNGSPSSQVTVTVTAGASASAAAAKSPAASAQARANARLLVSALATGSSESMLSARKLVSGPVMTHYVTLQITEDAAYEAAGQPGTAGSVTATGGNTYQSCDPQGGGCQSFTTFTADSAGEITGMSVDGRTVASRLAAGPSASGGGIKITDVNSYLYTSLGKTGVTFKVRNVSNHGLSNSDPAFLPALQTPGGTLLQYDFQASVIPGSLQPGQSAAVYVIFDTRIFTGTFIVRSNGGEFPLVSSKLSKPAG